MLKSIIVFGGAIFSIFNLLPIPWTLRLTWMKFLYFITVKSTLIFPSIISWTKEQNVAYKMGKQHGEEYESIVLLEKVLEYFDKEGITVNQVKQAVEKAETKAIRQEQLGIFIAQEILDPLTSEQIIKESLQSTRY